MYVINVVEGMLPSTKAFEWWLGNYIYLSYPSHLALVIITRWVVVLLLAYKQ